MKKFFTINLVLIMMFGFSLSAFASQPPTDYTVTFTVEDTEGNPITDAVITFGEDTYPAGQYVFTVPESNYGYFVEKHGYVLEAEGTLIVDDNKTVNHVLTPSVEMTFDGTTIDFSWNEQIGTFDPAIIINMQPYNTDGAFIMLSLYNDAEELQIFADVFEEFAIGGLEYHSGTSERINADFTGAQSNGIWGTHALDDNPAAGGSLRETVLNGSLFYGVMVDGTVGTVSIVAPTATGSDQLEVSYIYKAGVTGSFHIEVEAYVPWRPGTVGSAGYYTLAELLALEPIASFDFAFDTDPIVINTQPITETICDYETTDLLIDATVNNGETLTYEWYYNAEIMVGEESASVTVDQAGDYYCMLTAGADELMSETATITIAVVSPVLEAEITACDGTTVELDPGTFLFYDWSDFSEETTLDVIIDGTYSVTVEDANGCTAMAESEVTFITEILIPFEDTVYLCGEETLILESPEGDSYEWSTDEETQNIEVSTEGWYYLTVTMATCSGNDSTYVQLAELPEVFDLGEDLTACGASVTIMAPEIEDVDFLWTTLEETSSIDVTIDGTYGLTISNEFGCEAYDELDVMFDVELVVDINDPDTIHSCDGLSVLLDPIVGTNFEWSNGDGTASIYVTQQQWYSVTVSNDYECVGIDSVYVNFHSVPSINLGNDEESCADEDVDLDAPSAFAWDWSTTETTQDITVSETGSYSCTITDGNGCQNADTVDVTIFELPNVDLGADVTVYNNTTFILGVDGGEAEYEWSTGEETSHIVVDASTLSLGNHTYSVTVTNLNGCIASDAVVITITEESSVGQNIVGNTSLTPNPTNGIFRVTADKVSSIKVYDNIGKLILTSENTEIDMSDYPAGMYFVKIAAYDNVITRKLIKQ